jgi:hypothetical protein
MSKRKSKKSDWSQESKNVERLGCFPDYAHLYPQFKDPKYYNSAKESILRYQSGDNRLPRRPPVYTNWMDGPYRVIPSAETNADAATNLELPDTLSRCYKKAVEKGHSYFGLQNGGMCMTSDRDDFKNFDKLNPKECKRCKKICSKKEKPCGDECVSKSQRCDEFEHSTCRDNETNRRKGIKAGGNFTNYVYKIKDLPDKSKEDAWKEFKYEDPKITNAMTCKKFDHGFFTPTKTQLFTLNYFVPNNPIKGMVLDKSAGSGKTFDAINIADNFYTQGWKVLWVTRASLLTTPHDEIYKNIVLERLRSIILDKEPFKNSKGETIMYRAPNGSMGGGSVLVDNEPIDTAEKKIAYIQYPDGRGLRLMQHRQYDINFPKTRIITYGEFVDFLTNKGSQAQKDLRERFLKSSPNGDLLYKTLVIFDEAHNWTSPEFKGNSRRQLNERIDSVEISGKTFKSHHDVYENNSKKKLKGKDLLPAAAYRSYELSKKKSGKFLFLTATPMSTSPAELFFLLNVNIPKKKNRLDMDVETYLDRTQSTLRISPEGIFKFAKASQGKISYYDGSKDVRTYPRKVFVNKIVSTAFPDHVRKINNCGGTRSERRSCIRNSMLISQTSGKYFEDKVLEKYLEPEESNQDQLREDYRKNIGDAKNVFKFGNETSIKTQYETLKRRFDMWQSGDIGEKPSPSDDLSRFTTDDGSLFSYEEWRSGVVVIHEEARKKYEKMKKRQEKFTIDFAKFNSGKTKKKPVRPKSIDSIIGKNGSIMGIDEWWNQEIGEVSKNDKLAKRKYGSLKASLTNWKKDLKRWEQKKAESGIQSPPPPIEIVQILKPDQSVYTFDEWYLKSKGFIFSKKEYTPNERSYLKYVTKDKGSGLVRLKTENEYAATSAEKMSISYEPTKTGIGFIIGSANFEKSTEYFHKYMNFYAPVLKSLIDNIIRVDEDHKRMYGKGFKHVVFTTSVSEDGNRKFGSKAVISALAADPRFHVMLVYKPVGPEREVRLVDDVKGKMGVAFLGSGTVKNIYGKGGYEKIDSFNPKVRKATENRFNDKNNLHGNKCKIIVLDGKFVEGVNLYNSKVIHLLHPGLSPGILEQAGARASRNCKSNNIPFIEGIGAELEMYTYDLNIESTTGYGMIMSNMNKEERDQISLIHQYNILVKQFSIDYMLNRNITEFHKEYEGEIVTLDAENMTYSIAIPITTHFNGKSFNNMREFIVPAEYVREHGQWKKGQIVFHRSNQYYAMIKSVNNKTGTIRLDVDIGIVQSDDPNRSFMIAPGMTVHFEIPYGPDVIVNNMGVGGLGEDGTVRLGDSMLSPISIPKVKPIDLNSSYRNSVSDVLLLMLATIENVISDGGAGIPLHIALPKETKRYQPDINEFVGVWECGKFVHELTLNSTLMGKFLSPKTGISIMPIWLKHQRCDKRRNDVAAHANLLIYIPQWNIVERFEPAGYDPLNYNGNDLDRELENRIEEFLPNVTYLFASQSNIVRGALSDLPLAFSMFYLQMRLLYMSEALKNYGYMKTTYPYQFQLTLQESAKESGIDLEKYIRKYSQLSHDAVKNLVDWPEYNEKRPMWVNVVRRIKHLLPEVKQKTEAKKKQDKEESWSQMLWSLLQI